MSKESQIFDMTMILDSLCNDIPDEVCHTYSCSECKANQIYEKGFHLQSEVVKDFAKYLIDHAKRERSMFATFPTL